MFCCQLARQSTHKLQHPATETGSVSADLHENSFEKRFSGRGQVIVGVAKIFARDSCVCPSARKMSCTALTTEVNILGVYLHDHLVCVCVITTVVCSSSGLLTLGACAVRVTVVVCVSVTTLLHTSFIR